jgi:hypothetical protein
LKQYCAGLGRSCSWGMACAAGVDDSIWLSEILRRDPVAKRPEFLGGKILVLRYSSQATFATFDTAIDFLISVSKAHSETALCVLYIWLR